MKPTFLRAAMLLALAGSQACAFRVGKGGGSGLLGGKKTPDSASPPPGRIEGYARKLVEGKQAPLRLIARDGTTCAVSQEKFDSTRLGTSVWCTWTDPDR